VAHRFTWVAGGGGGEAAILCTIRHASEISTQYNFALCRGTTLILVSINSTRRDLSI
jgi:hypothetical protein